VAGLPDQLGDSEGWRGEIHEPIRLPDLAYRGSYPFSRLSSRRAPSKGSTREIVIRCSYEIFEGEFPLDGGLLSRTISFESFFCKRQIG